MKAVLFHPNVNAEHQLVHEWASRGVAVVVAHDARELKQLLTLHAASVDVVIIHNDPKMIEALKREASTSELAYLLTTDQWSEDQCRAYAAEEFSAHATFVTAPGQAPDPIALLRLLGAVFETDFGLPAEPSIPTAAPVSAAPEVQAPDLLTSFVLEPPVNLGSAGGAELQLSPETASGLSGSMPTTILNPDFGTQQISLEALSAPPAVEGTSPTVQVSLSISAPGQRVVTSGMPSGSDASSPDLSAVFSPQSIQISPQAVEPMAIAVAAPVNAEAVIVAAASDAPAVPIAPDEASSLPFALSESPGAEPSLLSIAPPSAAAGEGSELERELSHIFRADPLAAPPPAIPVLSTDAPGVSVTNPDVDTLKSYLSMREQDVAILTSQLRVARQQVQSLSESLKVEQARGAELAELALQQKGRLEEVEGAKQVAIDGLAAEVKELSFQIQVRNDKIRALESRLQEGNDETERMRDRVKTDLRKIRLRERELENKLEILKKDSEALIGARESKIVELKRKLDLLEFNLDLVQDQVSREREKSKHYRQQLERAAQVVRVAGGLLDAPSQTSLVDKKAS